MSRTYEQLAPVISALDDRIKTNLGAFPTDTAEGSIASFPDGADDIPLKSLVVNIDPVQSGSGDPSPDNVRPISGWTGANVTRCGKNLFDKSVVEVGALKADGTVQVTGPTKYVSGYIRISPNTSYYLSNVIPANDGRSGFWYDANKNPIEAISQSPYTLTSFAVVSPSNAEYARIGCYIASADICQLELGSIATPYEPYNGQTIPIDWQTEAGTVYGGKLDVLSGVLTVDRYFIDPSQWTQYGASNGYIAYQIRNLPEGRYEVGNYAKNKPLSNIIAEFGSFSSSTMNKNIIQPPRPNSNVVYMALQDGIDPTTVELSYFTARLITIQLTPHDVKTLLGQNNIFADTGDTEVEYRADTKLYIERLTEPDADMIADANIVSGSYFMVGNNLYRATANIASGASVIVGTNAVKVSLAQALNEINQ